MAGFVNPCHLGDIIVRQSNKVFLLCRVTASGAGLTWSYLLTVADLKLATGLALRFADSYKARAWIETPEHAYLQLRTDGHHA